MCGKLKKHKTLEYLWCILSFWFCKLGLYKVRGDYCVVDNALKCDTYARMTLDGTHACGSRSHHGSD